MIDRLLAIILGAALFSACSNDNLTEQDRTVQAEWAAVHKELRQRDELIPRLVELARPLAPNDASVVQAVLDSRMPLQNARTVAETIEAAKQQSDALAQLMAVIDSHPPVETNGPLATLKAELAEVENRIAVGRMRYNGFVQQYNRIRRQFPGEHVARLFNFRDYPFFEVR